MDIFIGQFGVKMSVLNVPISMEWVGSDFNGHLGTLAIVLQLNFRTTVADW